MFVQDVICPGISCATCFWCFDSFSTHVDCLRQNGSVSDDPRSIVCPAWLDNPLLDSAFLDTIEYPPSAEGGRTSQRVSA